MENLVGCLTLKDAEGRLDIVRKNESGEAREVCSRTQVFTLENGQRAKKLLAQKVDLESNTVYGIETDSLGKILRNKIGPGKWEIRYFQYSGPFCLVDNKYDQEYYRHEA